MRLVALSFIFFLCSSAVFAQQSLIKIHVQANYSPVLQLNNSNSNQAQSIGFKLSLYNFNDVPVEVGFRYSPGYRSSVAFSYGLTFAYIFLRDDDYLLKAGLNGGRIKMDEYKYEVKVGGIIEDEFHEIINPYVEWEWLFSDYASIFLKAGYRFLRSETIRVNEILNENKRGNRTVTSYKGFSDTRLYGSGFEFSIGLSIPITSSRQ